MKKTTLFFILLFIAVCFGCAKKAEDNETDTARQYSPTQKEQGQYLAYEHYFTVDTKEENLPLAYKKTIEACNNLKNGTCILLDSSISKGKYPSAHIKIRVSPSGIDQIVKVASTKGKITHESTHVEDLAKPVVDNKKRLAMLEEHRRRLITLQEKAANDIEALVKVSSELAKVQSEIEHSLGEKAFLRKRIELNIVTINFSVDSFRSFWTPIKRSFANFSGNLSEGISGTITIIAYLFPSIVILFVFFSIFRLYRKPRKAKKA